MIEDLQGESAVMAHVDVSGPVRVSKYGVDVDAIERIGAAALRRAVAGGSLAVVDEVGKMELACPAFVDALMELLDAPVPVLGTMHTREDSVTHSIRSRADTRVLHLTKANREEMPARLCAMVAELRAR
jgi:nucleoside-triphosphatase